MKHLRWLLPVAALVLLAVIIAWHEQIWWWAEVHTGTVNEPGPYYGFWSGFGSDLGELAIVAALAGMLRKHNCHVKACFRIGRHKVPGTDFICCAKHTPGGAPTHEHILRLHREHKERTTSARGTP